MSDESLGEEIRRRRTLLRISQGELAKLAGLSRNTIGNVEYGRGETAPRTIELLRDVLAGVESGRSSAPVRMAARPVDALRESIACVFDALVFALADDLVPPDPASPEAITFRATRRAYQHAARIARGEDL